MAWLCFISYVAVLWFGSSLFLVLMALIPEGQDGAWQQAMESWSPVVLSEMPLIIARSSAACLMLALSLTDLFVVAAGFGIYINNRTWIEGWDVDLVFRRLSQRLGKLVVLICLFGLLGQSAQGEPISTPAERIRDVKAQQEFVVHSVTDRDPEFKYSWDFSLPVEFLKFVVQAIGWSSVIAAVSLIGWAIWKNRHVFRNRGSGRDAPSIKQVARVVMGMQVSPDSLPENIPASAWALWVAGRHQEAMGLLYRGAISRVVEYGGVEIQESDTEGDCLERVRNTGVKAHPDYFKSLTAAWIRLAYAKTDTAESEVRALCDQWPFEDGRSR